MARNIKNLSECSDSEMVNMLSQAVSEIETAAGPVIGKMTMTNPQFSLFSKRMGQYIGMLRGMQLWYHSAHHTTRGTGFAGDHPGLYGSFYDTTGKELDGAIEKAVGISNDEEMGCPKRVTSLAMQVIDRYPSPVKMTSLAIASTALQIENDYQKVVKTLFTELERAGCLSFGLNDFLMSSANSHEEHIYKLQQRVKTELED